MGLFCRFTFSGPPPQKGLPYGSDVSRETIFAGAARRAMFHVKHFCVKAG